MIKIAAVVILYYPDVETYDFIQSYNALFSKIYVINNSETPAENSKLYGQQQKFNYIHDGQNRGIAARLNLACNLAIGEGFQWLLTMDQDSSFKKEDISAYITCLQDLEIKEQTAMAGVEFEKDKAISCEYAEVTSLITSGSMVNLALFKKIGSFDEELFIDQVDYEYCYRAILKGYKIIQFRNIFLQHALGKSSLHTSFKNFKKTQRSLHSPVRLYYMIRNYLYIKSKYKERFKKEISATEKDVLNRIKNNLFYGKERIKLVKYILRGIIDFKRKKMGKYSD